MVVKEVRGGQVNYILETEADEESGRQAPAVGGVGTATREPENCSNKYQSEKWDCFSSSIQFSHQRRCNLSNPSPFHLIFPRPHRLLFVYSLYSPTIFLLILLLHRIVTTLITYCPAFSDNWMEFRSLTFLRRTAAAGGVSL